MKTISKTYRLDQYVVDFIDEKAKEWDLNQSDTLEKVIKEYTKYIRDKRYEEDLIKASKDKEFMKEQLELAEADWIGDGI